MNAWRRWATTGGLLALAMILPAAAGSSSGAAAAIVEPQPLRNSGFSPYLWYPSRQWPRDFGVAGGRCNSVEVGFLAHGILDRNQGIGLSRWAERPVAVVLGPVLGPEIGARLGRDVDAADRGCLAQTLELAPDEHPVAWSNRGLNLTIRPLHGASRGNAVCREFVGRVRGRDIDASFAGMACRSGRGLWQMV